MPYLYSERLLSKINESEGTMHFLIKNAHRQDLKVVLRNGSAKSVQADFALIADTYLSEHFDISFNPNIVHYPAGGLATLGLIIRRISVKALPKPPQNTMRCLIIARIKNCSAKFTFKCEFQWPVEGFSSECFE